MYTHRNETEDELFTQRSLRIKQMRPDKVMQYLGINHKLIINPKQLRKSLTGNTMMAVESQNSESSAASNQHPDMAAQQFSNSTMVDDRGNVPYIEAIREIEKIQTLDNPGEMVGCLSASFEKLKTTVVDHHKGKFELSAMDDVLPLSIYTVALANLSTPASHQQMMADYLRCN